MGDKKAITNKQRFLCFSLGSQEFAIPLLTVREVIAVPQVTPVPMTPIHFVGIINVRGEVISVIDLREKLHVIPNVTNETAIIICAMSFSADAKPIHLGVVVDSINSVISPDSSEIAPKPEIRSTINSEYVSGVYKNDGQLILLLDIAKALNEDDHLAMRAVQKEAAQKAA